MTLENAQKAALEDLLAIIRRTMNRIEAVGDPVREPALPRDHFNCFGLLGPRGAGKSTLINELPELSERQSVSKAAVPGLLSKLPGRLLVLKPLDCSALPREIGPGAAVLMHFLQLLRLKKLPEPKKEVHYKDIERGARGLVGLYSRIGSRYQDLALDLSSSAEDYGDYLADGLQERLELKDRLAYWLAETLHQLDHDAVLVLLDDFDLSPAENVQAWLQAFQDELAQLRLLFVLAADFHRLEYLSWDAKQQFDDKTGRALLGKVLPPQNRVPLDQWLGVSRREFPPGRSGEHDSLGDLLDRCVSNDEPVRSLLARLLPERPRGLFNLYKSLEKSQAAPAGESARLPPVEHVLESLATGRGEPLLARRLREVSPEEWVQLFRFEPEGLSPEDWKDCVEAAQQRLHTNERKELRPFLGLNPVPTREDFKLVSSASSTSAGSDSNLLLTFDAIERWRRDPQWQDPLRHDRLRILPLRDAGEEDRCFWAELLLNLGLTKISAHRLRFLYQWPPAKERLEACRFKIAFSRRDLRRFFEDNVGRLSVPPLAWLRRDFESSGSEPVLEIGWAPLGEILRGTRDPLSSDLLVELLVDVSNLRPLDDSDSTAMTGLLARDVASLVLWTDALHRCPWQSLSTALGWELPTLLGLSAAFVRTAYVLALNESGLLDRELLSKGQQLLLDVCKRRDAPMLLRYYEEDLQKLLLDTFEDDLATHLSSRHDALAQAACGFFACPAYTSVKELLRFQVEPLTTPLGEER